MRFLSLTLITLSECGSYTGSNPLQIIWPNGSQHKVQCLWCTSLYMDQARGWIPVFHPGGMSSTPSMGTVSCLQVNILISLPWLLYFNRMIKTQLSTYTAHTVHRTNLTFLQWLYLNFIWSTFNLDMPSFLLTYFVFQIMWSLHSDFSSTYVIIFHYASVVIQVVCACKRSEKSKKALSRAIESSSLPWRAVLLRVPQHSGSCPLSISVFPFSFCYLIPSVEEQNWLYWSCSLNAGWGFPHHDWTTVCFSR